MELNQKSGNEKKSKKKRECWEYNIVRNAQ